MPQFWIAGAVVAVIVVRRFSRIGGAIVGMCVAIGLGIWGHWTFTSGAGVAFAGIRLSEPIFLALIVAWLAMETYSLIKAIKRRGADEETEDV
ncbi:MAG: hypothetical protein V3T05_04965 [Myxococcota bacterium]